MKHLRPLLRSVAVLVVASFGLLAPVGSGAVAAGAAEAVVGCPPEVPVADAVATASTVFTGTVRSLANDDRTAVVDVIRIWKGGPLPREVEVRGTIATQDKVATALDRTYAKGATYLFVPSAGQTPRFVENQCSATTTLTRELAAMAPAGGGDPPTGPTSSVEKAASPSLARFAPLGVGLVVAGGVGVALLLARRRTRAAQQATRPAPPA